MFGSSLYITAILWLHLGIVTESCAYAHWKLSTKYTQLSLLWNQLGSPLCMKTQFALASKHALVIQHQNSFKLTSN